MAENDNGFEAINGGAGATPPIPQTMGGAGATPPIPQTMGGAGATPPIPRTMVSQQTTKNGLMVCQATACTIKADLNADVTLPEEIAEVQNLAHGILVEFGHDTTLIGQLLDVIRASIHEDSVAPPENIDITWPKQIEDFIDTVERACELQINGSMRKIKELMIKLGLDVQASIACISILLKFPSKEAKFTFLKDLLLKDLSRQMAAIVFDEEFASLFTTLHPALRNGDGEPLNDFQRGTLQAFLEQIIDLITIRVAFRVDQLLDLDNDGSKPFEFKFAVSAAKILLAHHDTKSGDTSAMTRQIYNYLEQDEQLLHLFEDVLSTSLAPRSFKAGDTAVVADNGASGDDKP